MPRARNDEPAKRGLRWLANVGSGSAGELVKGGKEAFAQKEYRRAEDCFLRALSAGADQETCHRHLARIYNSDQNWSKALEQWQWLRDAAPDEIEPRLQVARGHFYLGHPAEAADAFRALLRLSPNDEEAGRRLRHLEKLMSTETQRRLRPREETPRRRPVEVVDARAPVTIAIATYNRSGFLADALRSCRRQTVRAEQIIVVNDGSSDDTERTVRSFAAPDLQYVNVGKLGVAHARNLATAMCTTKYVCVLDDDDLMLPTRLQDHMVSFNDGAQVSYGGWINFNANGELQYQPGKRLDEDTMLYVGSVLTHGACCYETAVLREFAYRPDVVGEDYDMVIRMVRSGVRCNHTGSYVLLRRLHDASLTAGFSPVQDRLRAITRSMVNSKRTDGEIHERTAAGRKNPELVKIDAPSVADIYAALGPPKISLRVHAEVPRLAIELFPLIDRLDLDQGLIELLDPATKLSASVTLASPLSTVPELLDAFESALRRELIKPRVSASAAPSRVSPMNYGTPAEHFRLAIEGERLDELGRAYREIALRREWSWYLVSREEPSLGHRLIYRLVSAPFGKKTDAAEQRQYADSMLHFVSEFASGTVSLIDGAPAG